MNTAAGTLRRLVSCAAAIILVVAGLTATSTPVAATTPSVQPNQVIFDGPNGSVNAIAKGSDGTTYMTGAFTAFGPQTGGAAVIDKTTGTLDRTFPWVNGDVLAVAPDGSGGYYIGGNFTVVLGQTRNCLAHIDADGDLTSWNPNLTGTGNCVKTMSVSGDVVYVGGTFTKVGTAARNRLAAISTSDGSATAWNPNAGSTVSTLAVDGDYVYVGGDFATVGGQNRPRIAALKKSDGLATDWNPDFTGSSVSCLLISGGVVFVGGNFTAIGGQTRSRLAALKQTDATATDWDPIASAAVNTMALSGSTLYVGGAFSTFGPTGQTVTRNKIAAFDLTSGSLTAWDPNSDRNVNSIVPTADAIYVGGNFTNIGGQARSRFAALSPSDATATTLNPAPNSDVTTLAVGSDSIFLGGKFTMVGPMTTRSFAAAIDSNGSLTSWNPSLSSNGFAIAVSGSSVYIGGQFTSVNTDTTSTSRNRIAEFDTSSGTVTSWNPGTSSNPSAGGLNDTVKAIAVDQTRVYIGGLWTNTGIQKLAAIDRTTGAFVADFPSIGLGTGISALSLSGSGTQLFVGGTFTKILAGTTIVAGFTNLAAIDISASAATVSSWKPVVGNSSDSVLAIATTDDTVYIGGSFSSIGASTARSKLAAFKRTPTLTATANSWNPNVGGGQVNALAVTGEIVYYGGTFNVSKRNKLGAAGATGTGTNLSWAAGDLNTNDSVKALIVNDGAVSVAGIFGAMTTASGPPTQNLTEVPTVNRTVTFDANDGTASTTTQTTNKTTPLTANAFTRNTYAFAGWGTSAEGPVVYADGADYSFTSDATLYAQWQQSTVTFDANGGTGTMPSQGGVTSTPLDSNTFTRAGYTFTGWGTSPGGPVVYADGASYPFASSTTLYAQWVSDKTVTFDANGGSGSMASQMAGVPTALTANAFSRASYTFAGWGTSAGGPVVYTDGATYPFDADVTLYAQWVHVDQTVTFDANGGTGTMAPQVANSPTTLTANSFVKASYTFAGWGTSAGGPVAYADGATYPFDADVTLYAQWVHVDQTVTFDANGGTGTMAPQVANSPTALTANTFTRTSYLFTGWGTSAGGPVVYADSATYPFDADITLYAQWVHVDQTVTFDANGGTGTMAPQIANSPTALTTNTFTKTNYTFTGWGTSAGGPVAYADGATYPFEADVTLYAQWVHVDQTVTFDANGGTGTMAPQIANSPTALTTNTYTKTDYTFTGWGTSADGPVAYANGATYPFDADITLYAQWVHVDQTVTFDANGGTGTMAAQVANSPTALTTNTYTRTSYIFTGWGTSAGGPVVYADGTTYPFDADITLYAQWVHVDQNVTFDANGGSGTMAAQVANSPTALTANTFTRTSYIFTGWGTSAGGPVVYADGATYPFNGDITLYAQWVHVDQTVTFDANGGTGTMAPQVANSPTALATNTFTRTSYTFTGWGTSTGGPLVYSDGATYPFNGDITLYAQWVHVDQTVTFDSNSGTGTMAPQVANSPTALATNTFTRTSYTFTGWGTSPGGPVVYTNGATCPFDADVTLYAQWVHVDETVTFDPNGGTGTMAPQVANSPTALQLNTFQRSGFTFTGWSASPNGPTTYADGAAYPFDVDVTLFAQWSENSIPTPPGPALPAPLESKCTYNSCANADLTDVNLSNTNLTGITFAGANLAGADLGGATLNGDSFAGANLKGANLRKASIKNTNFSGANLKKANFSRTDLRGAIFVSEQRSISRANLSKANLSKANLAKINLSGTKLTKANLTRAHLRGANLTRAQLVHANLTRAQLVSVTAYRANFDHAVFKHTNLRRARLAGATFTNATFQNTKFPSLWCTMRATSSRGC